MVAESAQVSAPTAQFLGLKDDNDVSWVMPRLTPHPVRTFREAARLSASFPQVPRTHINCTGDKPRGQPRTVQAHGTGAYREVQTGHDAMATVPQDVVALLRRAEII